MGNSLPLIIAIVVVVIVLIILVTSLRGQRSAVIEERLGRYASAEVPLMFIDQEEDERKAKDKKELDLAERIDKELEKRGVGSGWRTQLARADLKFTVFEFFILHLIAMGAMGVVVFFILAPGQIVQTIIAAGIGFFIPRIWLANKTSGRLKLFDTQLPDLLSLWVNSLRSGYSVMQALEAISREAPEPTAGEIRRVVREVQIGIPMEESLDHLLERMPSADLDLVITAVNIQREVGGNLAEILEVIGHTIRERIKIKGEISVLTAQGRITGWLIGGLPIALAIFLWLINPKYMGNLIEKPACGWPLLGIGLGLIGIGMAVIQRIVDIEV